jgi:hypothetical protein
MPRNEPGPVTFRPRLGVILRTTEQEGIMADRISCCRYEPSLDELLADEMMQPVLESAGLDREQFHVWMLETGERLRQSRRLDRD